MANLLALYHALWHRAESYAIRVREKTMPEETVGTFDGPSITMNPDYELESRTYYFVHAIGSIRQWSDDAKRSEQLFRELRAAREAKPRDQKRLDRAVRKYREFEEGASQYAVWLLSDLGYGDAIPSYTNFARADIEAMVHFHYQGSAPVWREFFADWNRRLARGELRLAPYTPKPVGNFQPVPMMCQQIVQEQKDS